MRKILIVDTETTGIPIVYTASFQDTDNWPRIIELSWELCWENGDTIEKACDLIQPDGWRFPTGEFWQQHGFNEFDSTLNGIPADRALTKLAVAMNCADVMVCHNLSYDKPIIECEFYRYKIFPNTIRRQLIANEIYPSDAIWRSGAGLRPEGQKLEKECTKLLATPIVKLPGFKGQYVWPKLEVAYEFAFGEKMSGAHHASSDVEATKKLYLWIKSLEEIL